MVKLLVLALLFVASQALWADDAGRRRDVEDLLDSSGLALTVEAVQTQFESALAASLKSIALNEEERVLAERYATRVRALFKQEVSWEVMRAPLADAYLRLYTDEEIKGLAAFYRSPLGRKMVANGPEMQRVSLAFSQALARKLQPKLQQMRLAFAAELSTRRQKR